MYYYHLRYNIYPAPGLPVEKEDWLILNTHHNEQQLKRLLVDQHRAEVTLIVASSICKEEYDSKKQPSANALSRKLQVSFKNISEWNITHNTLSI